MLYIQIAWLVSTSSEASMVILTRNGTGRAGIDNLSRVILCKALVAWLVRISHDINVLKIY